MKFFLKFVVFIFIIFLSVQLYYDITPKETVVKSIERLTDIVADKEIEDFVIFDEFPNSNLGLYKKLTSSNYFESINRDDLSRFLKIPNPLPQSNLSIIDEKEIENITIFSGKFVSFDSLEIPFYKLIPENYSSKKKFQTIILFSGHGNMDYVAFRRDSYQEGVGLSLANLGYIVYVMENRGMGKLSNLGDHLRIDAVARLFGESWMQYILTDALIFSELILNQDETNKLGLGGISTGGALSMLTSALNEKISATYVQGYLGTFKKTFGSRGNHDICNNIHGISKIMEMYHIGQLIFPRSALYVNGLRDTFYAIDAKESYDSIHNYYKKFGMEKKVSFESPKGLRHRMSEKRITDYFLNYLPLN
jgi:hypothetical protein